MKFGKTFRERRRLLPAALYDAVIDYNQWKKRLGSRPPGALHTVLDELETDCRRVDEAFVPVRRPSRLSPCCSSRSDGSLTEGPDKLVALARLNRECLRKLCKKIDKADRADEADRVDRVDKADRADGRQVVKASAWLSRAMAAQQYAFLGGSRLTLLELDARAQERQCPVCLDELIPRCVVFQCGHWTCVSCVLAMGGMQGRRGTLSNLLGACRHAGLRCPVCRHAAALSTLSDGSAVWPPSDVCKFIESPRTPRDS